MADYKLLDGIKKYKISIARGILLGASAFFILNGADAAYHHTSLMDIVQDIPRSVAWDAGAALLGAYEFVRSMKK